MTRADDAPREYEVIVVGAGQGGVPFAQAAARAGRRTALVERAHVGGTCINEGCTPTKTMVASARVAYLAGRGADYGVRTGPVSVDLERVRERKRTIVREWRESMEQRLHDTEGLDLLAATARFTGPHSLQVVGDETPALDISAPIIVIDTGTRPWAPPIPGLEDIPYLDSTSVMELAEVPEHLLVLGGGYVGVEFAQMFRRFGSAVTIIQREEHLVPREDPDVADALAEIFREDGIALYFDAEVHSVRAGGGEGNRGGASDSTGGPAAAGVRVRLTAAGEELTVEGSHLLVATGRTPNTDALDPGAAGIATTSRGFIPVDDRLQTNVPGVYAIGDVNGGPQFTHVSYDDFRVLRDNLLEGGNASTAGRILPYTVFTDPQLGRVGLSETDARGQGLDIRVYRIPMSYVARALEVDESRGLMKAVVDAASDRILGAAVLGLEGGELMGLLEVAILGGVTAGTLREGMFAHPTLAESVNNLFASPVE